MYFLRKNYELRKLFVLPQLTPPPPQFTPAPPPLRLPLLSLLPSLVY